MIIRRTEEKTFKSYRKRMIDLQNPAYDYWDEYAFGEDTEYIIKPIEHNIFPKWNQKENVETRNACTIVGAVNQLIRLFWIDLDKEKTNIVYKEAVKYCQKYWYVVWSGWSIPTATNYVCKWWNEIAYKTFNKEKVFWLRLYWSNEKIKEALDKWHLVGFWKYVNFATDQVEWLVWREPSMYPKMVWHRLNWSGVKYIKATWWKDISKAERWAVDNYHWDIWEYFAFKEMKPYINNGVYAYWYLILPESRMKSNIEKEKERIKQLKAVNCLIWVMTSTYWDIDNEFQLMSSAYAWALRDRYKEARPIIDNQEEKVYQSLVDFLSYAWKYADEESKEKYSELASYLRKKYWLQ
jgi:hypothetical protein